MVALLDVNVLVALAWPHHVHHELALAWFQENQALGWATCPTTESGFVRVSSNPRVLPEARSPHEAVLILRRIRALPAHVFWSEEVSIASQELVAAERLMSYRQVTDAHLLAVTLHRGGRLATLDRAVRNLVPPTFRERERVVVISDSTAP